MILKYCLLLSIFIAFTSLTLGEELEDEDTEFSPVTALHSRDRFERAIRKSKRRLTINRCCGKMRCGSKKGKKKNDDDAIDEDILFVGLDNETKKSSKKKSKGSKKKSKTTEAEEETTTVAAVVTTTAVVVTAAPAPAAPAAPAAPVVTVPPPVTTTLATTTVCSAKCPLCPTPYTNLWQRSTISSTNELPPGFFPGMVGPGMNPDILSRLTTLPPGLNYPLVLSDPSLGNFINASSCGITFVINTNKVTFQDAHVRCCTLGLNLWSINKTNLDCYLQNMPETPSQPKIDLIWSGGTDQGCPLTEAKYKWCGNTATAFDPLYWSASEPNGLQGVNRCASYNYSSLEDLKMKGASNVTTGGMKATSCDLKLPYICAGPITPRPKSIKKVECFYCQQNPCDTSYPEFYNILHMNGSIRKPERFGLLTTGCGKEYLVNYEQKLSFDTAEKKCCEFGMKLVTFDSLESLKCFGNSYVGNSRSLSGPIIVWTSGKLMDETCGKVGGSKLKWCSSGKFGNETWYNIKQTEPEFKCLTFNITINNLENNKYTSVDLNAADCEETNAFICESQTTIAPPPCYRNICPENETCEVDISKKTSFVTKNINPNYFRTMQNSCNRTYIATYVQQFDLEMSKKLCCQVGLKLLSFETNDERICLSPSAKSFFDAYSFSSTSGKMF